MSHISYQPAPSYSRSNAKDFNQSVRFVLKSGIAILPGCNINNLEHRNLVFIVPLVDSEIAFCAVNGTSAILEPHISS